jgi:hypothetical protein
MYSSRPGAENAGIALQIYGEMRRNGITLDLVCCNVCLVAAGKARRWDAVRPVFVCRFVAAVGVRMCLYKFAGIGKGALRGFGSHMTKVND